MERSLLADELYSEIQKLPLAKMDHKPFIHNVESNSIDNDDDLWYDDDASSNDGGVEKLENTSDMDREWQNRHDEFHTIGYRDGLMAGKEACAQEGFNIGFKESFFVGHRWGLVRGITSALACLPDGLKIKLVEPKDKLQDFEAFHKTVHALSTKDVLKSFHDGLKDNHIEQGKMIMQSSFQAKDLDGQSSDKNLIENHVAKFKSLVSESFAARFWRIMTYNRVCLHDVLNKKRLVEKDLFAGDYMLFTPWRLR